MKKRGKILALAAIVVVGAVVLSRCGHKNTAVEYESRRVDSVKAAGRCGFGCLKECGQQFKPYPGALCRRFRLPGGDGAGTEQRTEREDFL